ncbi:hypothetical protein ACFL43_02210 [Thermodesulfobacteriota bacterium]
MKKKTIVTACVLLAMLCASYSYAGEAVVLFVEISHDSVLPSHPDPVRFRVLMLDSEDEFATTFNGAAIADATLRIDSLNFGSDVLAGETLADMVPCEVFVGVYEPWFEGFVDYSGVAGSGVDTIRFRLQKGSASIETQANILVMEDEVDTDGDYIPDAYDNCQDDPNASYRGSCLDTATMTYGGDCYMHPECTFITEVSLMICADACPSCYPLNCNDRDICLAACEEQYSVCGVNGGISGCGPWPLYECVRDQRDADSDGMGDVCDSTPYCNDDIDCDNNNACDGVETCVDGLCQSGTTLDCDDGDVCNGGEFCDEFLGCQSGSPLDCDDDDVCTDDMCDSVSGCYHTPLDCDDGDICTLDSCTLVAGGCYHQSISCDDGDACTEDLCDPATGCVNQAIVCDDDDACTEDSCNPLLGCVYQPINCDDGNVCTDEICSEGVCQYANNGAPCSDSNACTENQCSGGSCIVVGENCCDDNLDNDLDGRMDCADDDCACHECDVDGECDDGNVCTNDVCAGGVCQHTNNSAPCSDSNACAENACYLGSCIVVGESCCDDNLDNDLDGRMDCADADCPCHECDVDGECDDENVCTNDTCAGGQCQNVDISASCDDGDVCTEDSCDPAAGCVNQDKVCDDGQYCNGVETCDAEQGCVNGVPPCPDGPCDEAGDVCVVCTDADSDGVFAEGGLCGVVDNCPNVANGPDAGTCIGGDNHWQGCGIGGVCPGGFCSNDREDSDADGPGDACDPQTCGNGIPEYVSDTVWEECDLGIANGSGSCSSDCKALQTEVPEITKDIDEDVEGNLTYTITNHDGASNQDAVIEIGGLEAPVDLSGLTFEFTAGTNSGTVIISGLALPEGSRKSVTIPYQPDICAVDAEGFAGTTDPESTFDACTWHDGGIRWGVDADNPTSEILLCGQNMPARTPPVDKTDTLHPDEEYNCITIADGTPTGAAQIMGMKNTFIIGITDNCPGVPNPGQEDADSDGLGDACDACPESDMQEQININGCDSGVASQAFAGGCRMADLIAQCADGAQNHGTFVSCVSHLTNGWKKDGLMTGDDKDAVQGCAGEAQLP